MLDIEVREMVKVMQKQMSSSASDLRILFALFLKTGDHEKIGICPNPLLNSIS